MGRRQLRILAQAAEASLNLWNPVEGRPLAWATLSVCLAAVAHRLLRARGDPAGTRHLLFAGAWIVGITIFSLARIFHKEGSAQPVFPC